MMEPKIQANEKCACCETQATTRYLVGPPGDRTELTYCDKHAAIAATAAVALAKLNQTRLLIAGSKINPKPEPCGHDGCNKPSTTVYAERGKPAEYRCDEHARKKLVAA